MEDIPGYETRYAADKDGNIWSYPRKGVPGNIIFLKKPQIGAHGYSQVQLSKDGEVSTKKVHRIIAGLFVENPDSKPHVNHINGIKTDNRSLNLEWCSISENLKHAYRIGLKSNVGMKNPRNILTNVQVVNILHLSRSGKTTTEISTLYKVSYSCIWGIVTGKNWTKTERGESRVY